jgi:hypothetical protein
MDAASSQSYHSGLNQTGSVLGHPNVPAIQGLGGANEWGYNQNGMLTGPKAANFCKDMIKSLNFGM